MCAGWDRYASALPPASAGAAAARQKSEDDLAELVDRLGSKNAGLQARAVKGLLGLGKPAVPYLASALRDPGNGIAVREAIVDGLQKMGPASERGAAVARPPDQGRPARSRVSPRPSRWTARCARRS